MFFALLGNALLTCCITCQHNQPHLMRRLQGGSGAGFLQSGLVNAVVRLSPEGAYIYTIRVTVTSLSRSSKWVRWDGSLRGEKAELPSIRHGVLQLNCVDLMPLRHFGSVVSAALSQQEGQRFHLASSWRFYNLTLLARTSPSCSSCFSNVKDLLWPKRMKKEMMWLRLIIFCLSTM